MPATELLLRTVNCGISRQLCLLCSKLLPVPSTAHGQWLAALAKLATEEAKLQTKDLKGQGMMDGHQQCFRPAMRISGFRS